MVGITVATEAHQVAVKEMIKCMMEPKAKPKDMSFTMGWDVVASYSEDKINKLLTDRHEHGNSGMLQEFTFEAEEWNKFAQSKTPGTKKGAFVKVNYRTTFGPPLLQFDPTATAVPMCSIQMKIIQGTIQMGDDDPEDIPADWTLKLNNILLLTAKGELSDQGIIKGNPPLIPGTEAITFGSGNDETQHVVLGFEMSKGKIVVEAIAPTGTNMNLKEHIVTQSSFQDAFKEFFVGGPDEVGKPKAPSRSLSYSIACVNNKRNDKAVDLTPTKFQFATYFGTGENKDVRLISIFIEVKGGPKRGQTEKLQEGWTTQWFQNGTSPVPRGLSASLIISSKIFTSIILTQGFGSSWTVEEVPSDTAAGTKVDCKNSKIWDVSQQDLDYSGTNIFHIDGFSVSLKDWPLQLTFKQDDPGNAPTIYAYWEIKANIHWENTFKVLAVGKRVTGTQGYINALYRMCDSKKFNDPLKLNSDIAVSDDGFSLDLKLETQTFRMDQSEENGIDYGTWKKGMEKLWSQAPAASFSPFGIRFLRTTNLLMPGSHVIDINEGIGLRIPKDLVLVGDVEEEKSKA